MGRSSADLVTEALRLLNVIAGDQEADGFERDNAVRRWQEMHAELVDDGLAEFDADDIPLDAFRAVARLFADVIAPTYGRAASIDPDDPMHPARDRLRRRISLDSDGEQVTIEEF